MVSHTQKSVYCYNIMLIQMLFMKKTEKCVLKCMKSMQLFFLESVTKYF